MNALRLIILLSIFSTPLMAAPLEVTGFASDRSEFQGVSVGTTFVSDQGLLAHISVRSSDNLGGTSIGFGKQFGLFRIIAGVTEANTLDSESGFVNVGGVQVYDDHAIVRADDVWFIDAEYDGWFAQYSEYEGAYTLQGSRVIRSHKIIKETISDEKKIRFSDSVFYLGYRFRIP